MSFDVEGYACISGLEIANVSRVLSYQGCGITSDGCPCAALDDDYVSPEADPAPWYSSATPESGDFLGFMPSSMVLSVPASRPVSDVLGGGATIGPEKLQGRILEVIGWMIAADQQSMYWGQRWLTQALRGRLCGPGCQGDEVTLLPFCRDECTPDCDDDFRRLVGAALVDGPRFSELSYDGQSFIGQAQFQIASVSPWLWHPAVAEVEETVVAGDSDCSLITTDDWFDGEALTLTVSTEDGFDAGEVTLTITESLDGTCPEDRVATSVTYVLGPLEPESSLTVDGVRKRVTYANPTSHRDEPGYDRLTWDGSFCWPIVGACNSVCLCVSNDGYTDIDWSVSRSAREL